jgi:hypothetical protein
MILYQLKCSGGHEFDAWFRDSASFEEQCSDGDVECPFCGVTKVSKALMAPNLSTGAAHSVAVEERAKEVARKILRAVNDLRDTVEDNCDYVGDKFAEEARRIHYGETDERGIYGEATPEETTDLDDEGIDFYHVPWSSRRDN